jgi:hypothetical protein
MARPSITEVIANAAIVFPDNMNKEITAAKLRTWITYMLSAFYPAYAIIYRAASHTQTADIAPKALVFTNSTITTVVDYTTTPASGTVSRIEHGACIIEFSATVEAVADKIVTFTLYQNGVATGWLTSINTQGAGKPVTADFTALVSHTAAANYQIQFSAEANVTVLTLTNLTFRADSQPMYSYT